VNKIRERKSIQRYLWLMDLWTWKQNEEMPHPPLWVIEPKWEQEIMYDEWLAYSSYFWQGAKSK